MSFGTLFHWYAVDKIHKQDETQILLDPLPAESRKRDVLVKHRPILLLWVVKRHVCLLMRDVETEFLWKKERSVIYHSSFKRRNTFQGAKPHVHLHFISTIVDVVGMEQRIQCWTTIHEVAITEAMNNCVTPPCHCKRDSVVYSTRSEPTCLEESFSTMMTVTLYPLGILSCRIATPHSPHASSVHSCS